MRAWLMIYCMLSCIPVDAQPVTRSTEQQLEQLATQDEADLEDDQAQQQLEQYARHRLNINGDAGQVLLQAGIVTALQAGNLDVYRSLFGDLVSVYELQAVPGWDVGTVRRVLPFIQTGTRIESVQLLLKRILAGEHSVVMRVSSAIGPSGDEGDTVPEYAGSRLKVFVRYRYAFRDKLQYGFTAEKDAGESLFRNGHGFDFYSAHIFARDLGVVKTLALGDFTVNMGQGLIQWQSMAFKKSADAMNVKRQSAVLRPYNSAGESNFFRGAGITLRKQGIEATVFGSIRQISSNQEIAADGTRVFTSFLRSGYNRTVSELADRNNLRQLTAGGVVRLRKPHFQVSLNAIAYHFSLPLRKKAEPYNLFAMKGDTWYNGSADFMYTWKNMHWFGELAFDRDRHGALVGGVMGSIGRQADLTFLYRRIAGSYQAVTGNTFSEASTPGNEEGFYAGITFRPADAWKTDLYADIYSFPWLKYRTSAPSRGRDWMLQLTYTPNRQVEINTRLKRTTRETNVTGGDMVMEAPTTGNSLNWRTGIAYQVSRAVELRQRVEAVFTLPGQDNGFLAASDFLFKPMQKPFDFTIRTQFFETGSYQSRIYAFENDVLYSQSVGVFSGSGLRYYGIVHWKFGHRLDGWVRWGETRLFSGHLSPEAASSKVDRGQAEIKIQARFLI